MAKIDTLKSHFAFLASSQGYISEDDYHTACHSITDSGMLQELADWIVEKDYKLVKGVGPQYQQEVMQKVKNPNVNDVKDTKHRTHKNKNKFQKSKKKDADWEEDERKLEDQSAGWDRFKLVEGDTWDYVIETGMGNPTEEEENAIMRSDYYGKEITDESIERLKKGLPWEPKGKFSMTYSGVDGKEEMSFDSAEEAKEYIVDRSPLRVSEDGFGTDYASYSFNNFTLSDLGLSHNEYGELKTDASFHLNKTIEDMQEFEDEFLPAWKKWKASLNDDKEFLAQLAAVGLTAQDFSNYEQAQRSIMQLIESYANEIPEDAHIDHGALQSEFLKIDPRSELPINQRITNAISRMYDPVVLKEIFDTIFRGVQAGFEKVPPKPDEAPGTPEEPMPSGTREIEFDLGPSGLETASKKPRARKVAATVARIGYSDKEKLNIKFENGAKFSSYVAETPLQKAAGLEVFDSLATTEGLFFPFEEEGSVTFHMGAVAFPIDIVFLMESPNGLEVGKVVANIEPGAPDWWSYPNTGAVLEVAGGMCKKSNIKVGSVCNVTRRIEADTLPPEYSLSLPDYAGEHGIFDLFKLLSEYHSGQSDPIYAVQSRESKDNISLDELEAIESLLEDIDMGRYMPGYPHGQLAPGEGPMNKQEEEEYENEQAEARKDMSIAESWLPEIRELISENSPEEDSEPEPEEDDIFMQPSGSLGGRTSVSAGGKFLGEFSSDEEAEAAIKEWMEEHKWYPNVWRVSDHGNIIGPIVLE